MNRSCLIHLQSSFAPFFSFVCRYYPKPKTRYCLCMLVCKQKKKQRNVAYFFCKQFLIDTGKKSWNIKAYAKCSNWPNFKESNNTHATESAYSNISIKRTRLIVSGCRTHNRKKKKRKRKKSHPAGAMTITQGIFGLVSVSLVTTTKNKRWRSTENTWKHNCDGFLTLRLLFFLRPLYNFCSL